MIDFTKFVNSNAVRNHLQQIRYQPTALEAAWLVWQCETISLNIPPGRRLSTLSRIVPLTAVQLG